MALVVYLVVADEGKEWAQVGDQRPSSVAILRCALPS